MRILFSFLFSILGLSYVQANDGKSTLPLLTTDIELLSSGEFLLTNKGTSEMIKYDKDFSKVLSRWYFDQTPTGVTQVGDFYYVTSFSSKGKLTKIDSRTDKVVATLELESGAMYPVATKDSKTLYVANQFSNTISKVDLESFTKVGSVKVLREPKCFVLSKDETLMFVANFLPYQRADIEVVAADVTVIDTKTFKVIKHIKLARGANALRGITLSTDGKYMLVTHNFGRYYVPTNQLRGGWQNTSAVSVINTKTLDYEGVALLDDASRGAAGVEQIAISDDKIIVAHAGVHEISIIDYKPFIDKLINYPQKDKLDYDLNFMEGIRVRLALVGKAPRDLVVRNGLAYIPTYFSDTLNIVDLTTKRLKQTIALQPERIEGEEHIGERIFNDALYCLEQWQSCNGCHPGEARTDGMNWDLMNDGLGNPKSCKSLLFSYDTPPSMISGIRSSADIATRKGFEQTQIFHINEADAAMVDIYLYNLKAVPSPFLVNGELSQSARRGEKVFNRIGCIDCHNGEFYTDMNMYRIGEGIERANGWDTPTLREVWRTGPYLFDGRAVSLREVFEVYKHGINSKLSNSDMDDLVEYVSSL